MSKSDFRERGIANVARRNAIKSAAKVIAAVATDQAVFEIMNMMVCADQYEALSDDDAGVAEDLLDELQKYASEGAHALLQKHLTGK